MGNANEKFMQLMFEIGMNYGKKLNDDERKFFAMQAKRFGFDKFNTAVRKHMEDPDKGMFMPKIADIVANIQGTQKSNIADIESKAQFQWMQVDRAIRNLGSYTTPSFKDPITSAVLSVMGGWVTICALTSDQLVWKQKEFIKNYADFTNKPLDQLPNQIQGREDLQLLKSDDKKTLAHIMDKIAGPV